MFSIIVQRLSNLLQRKRITWDPYKCYKNGRIGSRNNCRNKVGRPTDFEMDECDSYCCQLGFLTGHCTNVPQLQTNSKCRCTNDNIEAKCGLDGAFLGSIRCPFDRSACKRKACREGGNIDKAHCGGFLKMKCKW